MSQHKCRVNLLNALKENIAVIILITLVCGIVGFVIPAFVFEKRYVSEAELCIDCSADERESAVNLCRILSESDYVLDRLSAELYVLGYMADDYRRMISFSWGNDEAVSKISVEATTEEEPKLIAHELASLIVEEYDRLSEIGSVSVCGESSYSYPDVTVFTMVGFIAGFFASYAVFLLFSLSDKRIKNCDDLEEKYSIPVFAEIPGCFSADGKSMKNKSAEASERFVLNGDTASDVAEAYRMAAERLTSALSDCCNKITVITSCKPAEGKSTVCLNLAATMAKAGKKVLLIDGDMRKPVQHSLLKIDNSMGLSSFLSGDTDCASDVISENVEPCLDVLPSGPLPDNPGELLAGENINRLLDMAEARYDYIFIDAPPVTAVSDAFLLDEETTGIVFVIKEGSTTYPQLEEALRNAKITRSRIHGFIMTNCKKAL